MHYLVCAILILWPLVCASRATVLGLSQQPIQITSEENTPFDSAFDTFVEATLLEWRVPGLSIAIVDDGKVFSKVSSHRLICTPSSASAQ